MILCPRHAVELLLRQRGWKANTADLACWCPRPLPPAAEQQAGHAAQIRQTLAEVRDGKKGTT